MKVAVFCASAEKIPEIYPEAARDLGKRLARKNWDIIYGGTDCGCMRELAVAALAAGGKVEGVIPACIESRGVKADNLTKLSVVADMKERKQLMRDGADAFIALPGGWGTLEEITEVITLKQLGEHRKPIVFINTGGFYDPFFAFLQQISGQGFISSRYSGIYRIAGDAAEAIDYIEQYREKAFSPKYGRGCTISGEEEPRM